MGERQLEVLAPAGDLERVAMAVAYGAGAVYLSGPGFGMRPAGRKSLDDVAEAARFCHGKGVRLYITCNTTPTDEEEEGLPAYLRQLEEIGADAVIVGDIGVLSLCRRHIPRMPVHMSTQTGILSTATALALRELGASRVILARELPLPAIARMRRQLPPDLEMEAFVHGSMCVSVSGRCLLSNYLAGRDVNRGQCAQPCRWRYCLSEERRPGEYFPIEEDENGTYILNSRDMCMIDHVPELWEAGVSSIKLEGRTKSAYYVATVTNAYRHAARAAQEGRELEEVWRREVYQVSHRPYSTGFYFGQPGQHTRGSDYFAESDFVAVVESCREDGSAVVCERNRFAAGERLELLCPDGTAPLPFVCGEMRDENGSRTALANRPMQRLALRLPHWAPALSILRRPRAEGDFMLRRRQP